jgi:hypothetical protein
MLVVPACLEPGFWTSRTAAARRLTNNMVLVVLV